MWSMRIFAGMLLGLAVQGCATTTSVMALNDGSGARAIETRLSSSRPNSLAPKMMQQERRIADICGGTYELIDGDALSLVTTPRRFYLLTKFRCTSGST